MGRRVSKGKLKYIRQLYHYRIETCKRWEHLLKSATMWFIEPDPKVRKITEEAMVQIVANKGYYDGVKRLNREHDTELCITFDSTNYPNFNRLNRTRISLSADHSIDSFLLAHGVDQLVDLNEGWLEPLVIKLPDASGA